MKSSSFRKTVVFTRLRLLHARKITKVGNAANWIRAKRALRYNTVDMESTEGLCRKQDNTLLNLDALL